MKKLIHWVFNKYIDSVEIEVKVRDMEGFKEIKKIHEYTDKKMPRKDKVLFTYLKKLFIENKDRKNYGYIKMIYYSSAGHYGKSEKLLYPLK